MHTLKTDSNAGVTSPLVQALQSYEWGLWRSLKFHFHIPAAWKVIRDQACVGG